MQTETATLLMESVAANRLSILLGAGLSMAPPSSIPGAATVASICAATYKSKVGNDLPEAVAGDIEKMAVHFRSAGSFEKLFINTLVPWELFNTDPNLGHEAVADFLGCGAIREAVTTNYDRLVEESAQKLGEPFFRGIADIADLGRTTEHKPYLKVHGCEMRALPHTIWCKEQFEDEPLKERARLFRNWLAAELVGRDILIVGFWSEWEYLSDVFASALPALGRCSLVLVDPSAPEALEAKAPKLWRWAHGTDVRFVHERQSGAEFLDEFRKHFATNFLRQLLDASDATYRLWFGEAPRGRGRVFTGWTSDTLYQLRRDLTGQPRHRPVRASSPQPSFDTHTALHQRLLDQGATYEAHTYTFGTERIRLVSGHSQLLSRVKEQYQKEPPMPVQNHKVVCIGAINDAVPVSVIRPDEPPGILTGGTEPTWTSHEYLLPRLRTAP
jgi:hypothetical protein